MHIVYETEVIGDANKKYYADESLITHYNNNNQIWLLGVINNATKKFRMYVLLVGILLHCLFSLKNLLHLEAKL